MKIKVETVNGRTRIIWTEEEAEEFLKRIENFVQKLKGEG